MDDFRDALIEEIPRLRRFARGLAANVHDADDLVQATLIRAMERSESWKRGTNLRAWLFTILHNLFISEFRKTRRAREWTKAETDMPSRSDTVGDQQVTHLRLREVEDALQELPADQRSTIVMVAIEGLSYEEAAAIQDVPVGTVRSRLSRGRAELRRRLQDPGDAALHLVKG